VAVHRRVVEAGNIEEGEDVRGERALGCLRQGDGDGTQRMDRGENPILVLSNADDRTDTDIGTDTGRIAIPVMGHALALLSLRLATFHQVRQETSWGPASACRSGK